MIQYGSTEVNELKFAVMKPFIEPRDEQWIDVEIHLELDAANKLPEDLSELSALLICTYSGGIAQIVPQDEGRDCEYQFTESEKEQLRNFYENSVKKQLLEQLQKA